MLPRIKEVRPMPDYCLRIVFDDGRKVLYDVKDDIQYSKKLESWWKNSSFRNNPYAGAKLLDDDNFYDIFINSLNNVDDAYNTLINNIHN